MGELLIIVPTLNEIGNIETAISKIAEALPDAHILVIDDASVDGTWQKAMDLKKHFSQLDVMVRRNTTPGLGYSIIDGYRYALDHAFGEVCIVDCDLQQDPADVAILHEKSSNVDILIGSRYLDKDSLPNDYDRLTKILSTLANMGIRLLFRVPWRDITTDFYLIKTHVLESVAPESLTCMGFALFSEIKLRAQKTGFSIAEIPLPGYVREHGDSKRSFRQIVTFGREILAMWVDLAFSKASARKASIAN